MNASFKMINNQNFLFFGIGFIFHAILAKNISIVGKNTTANIVSTCKKENLNQLQHF